MKTIANVILTLLCISVFCRTVGATVRRVPSQYTTIQLAINAAEIGDTVLVDEGTYKENIIINKKITVGSLFVLDGDTSHISRTIIDGSQPLSPNFAAVVTIDGTSDTTTVVAGFTITGGKGNRRNVNYPGMQYQMVLGMGIDIAGGGARIHHNIVRANNVASPNEYMGGVINIFDVTDKNGVSYAIVENNAVTDNDLVGLDGEGGAFAIGHSSTIRDNVIARNTTRGVTYAASGAAFEIWNGLVTIERNLIIDNSASHFGGGLYALSILTPPLAPQIEMVNNIVAGNHAGTSGGGLFVTIIGASVNMVNNTFASNSAPAGGSGIVVQSDASVRALNTILWDSSASEVVTATGGSFIAAYCDIAGGFTGTGNINADPLFVNFDAADTCYINDGPARDAGVDTATVGSVLLTAPTTDFRGRPREPYPHNAPDLGAHEFDRVVSVENRTFAPAEFVLSQNYPNPFNPTTVISYQVPAASMVTLVVYDILGREAASLVNEEKAPGIYEVRFDASHLASGVYFYRLQAGDFIQTKKLIVMK
jgi:hypothetical protein